MILGSWVPKNSPSKEDPWKKTRKHEMIRSNERNLHGKLEKSRISSSGKEWGRNFPTFFLWFLAWMLKSKGRWTDLIRIAESEVVNEPESPMSDLLLVSLPSPRVRCYVLCAWRIKYFRGRVFFSFYYLQGAFGNIRVDSKIRADLIIPIVW